MVAVVRTLSKTHSAILIDISRTGARLRGDRLPDEGQELILSVENLRSFGSVAWKRHGECGVAFDESLPALEVEVIRHKASAAAGFSPELRAAFDAWTLGSAR